MTRVTGAFRYRTTTTIMAGVFAGLIVTPPQQLLGQSTVMTPGMTAGTIPAASASATISSTNATISNTGSVANIANVGSLSGSGTFTASGLSTVITTAAPPTSNGQGLITILVENNGSSAPTSGSLACWDSTSTATATNCAAGAASGVIGIVYATPVTINSVNYSQIVRMGTASCTFDGTPTPALSDYVVPSTSNAGHCMDGGSSYPPSKQPVGIIVSGASSSSYYVFTMNDQPPASASLGTPNTWTAGAQSFAAAASLVVPTAMAPTLTIAGSIAYDDENYRYALFQDGQNVIPVVAPINNKGAYTGTDTLCALAADTGQGCQNTTYNATTAPRNFKTYLGVAPGFFVAPSRSTRVTYHMTANSSSGTPPTLTFYLIWTSNSVNKTIFQGVAATPPASLSGQQFTVSCLVTADAAASTSSIVYANCTASALGSTTVTGTGGATYTVGIPAIPAWEANTAPIAVDTLSSGEVISLALSYSAATSGNAVTLLSAIQEVIQ